MHDVKRSKIGLSCWVLAGLLAPARAVPAAQITPEDAGRLERVALLEGHTGPVFALAFSPDGKSLVSGGSAADHSVRVWDVPAGTQRALLTGNGKQVAAVAFGADGSTALSAGYDATVRIWDAGQGHSLATLDRTAEQTLLLIDNLVAVFSADGSRLAYSNDLGQGPFLFNIATRHQQDLKVAIGGSAEGLGPIALDGAGSLLAVSVGEQGAIDLVDTSTAKQLGVLRPPGSPGGGAMALSRDGAKLAVSNDTTSEIHVFDVAARRATAVLRGHRSNAQGMLSVTGLAFSPDGKLLASTSYDGSIRVWNVATGMTLATLAAAGGRGPTTAAWSPNQSLLATADLDGSIALWAVR